MAKDSGGGGSKTTYTVTRPTYANNQYMQQIYTPSSGSTSTANPRYTVSRPSYDDDDYMRQVYPPPKKAAPKKVATVTKPKGSAVKAAVKKTPSYAATMAKVYQPKVASNRAKTLGVKPAAASNAPRSVRKVAVVAPQAGLSAMRQVNAPVAPAVAAPSYTGMAGVTRGAGPGAAAVARARSIASAQGAPTYASPKSSTHGPYTPAPAAAIPPMAPLLRGMTQAVAPIVNAVRQNVDLPAYNPLSTLAQNWRVGDNVQRLLGQIPAEDWRSPGPTVPGTPYSMVNQGGASLPPPTYQVPQPLPTTADGLRILMERLGLAVPLMTPAGRQTTTSALGTLGVPAPAAEEVGQFFARRPTDPAQTPPPLSGVPAMMASGINTLQRANLLAPAAAAASSVMPWLRAEGAAVPAGAQNPLAMNAASGSPMSAIGALIAQALTRQQNSGAPAPLNVDMPVASVMGPPGPTPGLRSPIPGDASRVYNQAGVTGPVRPAALGNLLGAQPMPTTPPRAIMPDTGGGDGGGYSGGGGYSADGGGYASGGYSGGGGGYSGGGGGYTPYQRYYSSGYTPYRSYYGSGYQPRTVYYSGGGGGYSSGGGYTSGGGGTAASGGGATAGTTEAATGWGGLPAAYITAFTQAFNMKPEEFYTAAVGGSDQAVKDYQNFISLWQNRTNRPMTPTEVTQVLTGFDAYTAILGRNPTMSDLVNYLNLILAKPETPESVSYLKMAEI